MRFKNIPLLLGAGAIMLALVAAGVFLPGHPHGGAGPGTATAAEPDAPKPAAPAVKDSVDLSEAQVKGLKVDIAATHAFALQRTAVGNIDFNENRSVPVFPPYQGKIIEAYGDVGDPVAKGKTLYTIDSPDLVQAESALIAAAGMSDLTSAVLKRARELYQTKGIAEKDMEQAVSDQQAAEGALKAARAAVRVFGKTDAQIDTIISSRRIDPALVVAAPVAGRITARMAQPGLLVQPGNSPAPFTISDVSSVWMVANVAESDSPLFRVGQAVNVGVLALPQRTFLGKITAIGESIDPNTHTVVVRSEVRDPKHELRAGMLATFVIQTGTALDSVAVPFNGVVREGDGTMSVWVTTDRRHFTRRTVSIGLQQDGLDQITEGLQPGQLVVTDGAIFLSNMLVAAPDS